MAHNPTREEVWAILTDHVKSPSLISHALAVEAVMRYVARKKSADEELWGVIGLIHDVDYEEHPDEHLRHAPEILRRHGWPEECIRAVASHGWGLFTDVAPVTDLERTHRGNNRPQGKLERVTICSRRRTQAVTREEA